MKKPKVLVILGPTASGKSDLAVRLAKKLKGEVISADSRQVYKGLNIGTGKITKQEMEGIPHHLLDVADPRKYFSVAEYKKLALLSLRYIETKKKLPIICGGTGFYIDTLIGKIDLPEVPPNKALRRKLEKLSVEKLFKILLKKDSRRAKEIDPRNKVRIIRALEIVEKLGKVPEVNRKPQTKNYEYSFIGIKPSKEDLEKRIYKRILKRLNGMIQEAKKLKSQKLPYSRMEALGLEYRYLARLLQNKITKQEFIEQLYSAIKDYSKRQMTWFRRNKKIKWFAPNEYGKIEKWAKNMLG
ncbi:MAG: tRNA (adenosine(37)-N6)-dimethylallyltransferase MiaA [Minisyncoccota bacterium]